MRNPRRRSRWTFTAAALLAAACLPALAPAQAPKPGAAEPAQPGVLGGPSVSPEATPAKTSLVEREMGGQLVRLETRPEQAALALLNLTPAQQAATDEVLTQRAAQVARFLQDHYELFLSLQGLRQSMQGGGENRNAQAKLREFRDAAQPLLKPALVDQLTPKLDADRAARLKQLTFEYMQALATEAPAGPGQARRPARPTPAVAANDVPPRVELGLLSREIARTLGSLGASRREKTEDIIQAVAPTPEQEARLREIIRTQGEKGGLSPTIEQRAEMMRAILAELNPEQRRKLMLRVRRG